MSHIKRWHENNSLAQNSWWFTLMLIGTLMFGFSISSMLSQPVKAEL